MDAVEATAVEMASAPMEAVVVEDDGVAGVALGETTGRLSSGSNGGAVQASFPTEDREFATTAVAEMISPTGQPQQQLTEDSAFSGKMADGVASSTEASAVESSALVEEEPIDLQRTTLAPTTLQTATVTTIATVTAVTVEASAVRIVSNGHTPSISSGNTRTVAAAAVAVAADPSEESSEQFPTEESTLLQEQFPTEETVSTNFPTEEGTITGRFPTEDTVSSNFPTEEGTIAERFPTEEMTEVSSIDVPTEGTLMAAPEEASANVAMSSGRDGREINRTVGGQSLPPVRGPADGKTVIRGIKRSVSHVGGGGSWVSGLMSSMFGDGGSQDEGAHQSEAGVIQTEQTGADGEVPPMTSLTEAGFTTEEGGEERMAEAGEDTAKPQAQAITEVAVNGVSTEGATAAKALDNDMLEKRSEAMAEEVKAFLQDSEDEGEAGKVKGERAEDVAPPQQGEGEEDGECVENDEAPEETMAEPRNSMEDDAGASKGARSDSAAEAMAVESEGAVGGSDDGGGGVAEPVDDDDDDTSRLPSLRTAGDTEFSAKHAKKVIGAGVVLKRKASISSTALELKNKSDFSSEDAETRIGKGAIQERTRRLIEEQEALRAKHATERQDTDLPTISGDITRKGSVKDKAQVFHQAIESVMGDKIKPVHRAGRLSGDWTQRRESLEQFVVKYDPPPMPEGANASGEPTSTAENEAPTRYVPALANRATVPGNKARRDSSSSGGGGSESGGGGSAVGVGGGDGGGGGGGGGDGVTTANGGGGGEVGEQAGVDDYAVASGVDGDGDNFSDDEEEDEMIHVTVDVEKAAKVIDAAVAANGRANGLSIGSSNGFGSTNGGVNGSANGARNIPSNGTINGPTDDSERYSDDESANGSADEGEEYEEEVEEVRGKKLGSPQAHSSAMLTENGADTDNGTTAASPPASKHDQNGVVAYNLDRAYIQRSGTPSGSSPKGCCVVS